VVLTAPEGITIMTPSITLESMQDSHEINDEVRGKIFTAMRKMDVAPMLPEAKDK
jgi:hypothetical protein